ncbi:SAG family member [Eimeria brunetti]|uniref:SAG family member n=1 Tax=Eimeria brunetti TaxID=51314 RepID=U6L667_9EIME|nr:SAG family member [Eimeria brunetti]
MAPFYGTAAAVCLVALSGIRGVAAQQDSPQQTTYKLKAQEVTEDAYLAVNLARNGGLPVRIKEVTENKNLVSTLTGKINAEGSQSPGGGRTDDQPLEKLKTKKPYSTLPDPSGVQKEMFHQAFEYPTGTGATPDYRQTLEEALKAGLDLFSKKYPGDTQAWEEIWKQDAGASLGYLLGSNSTQIGCAIGRCTKVTTQTGPTRSIMEKTVDSNEAVEELTNKAVLLCQLEPPATKNTAPFDEAYFTGLIARTTELANMTEEDLKAPTNDGTAVAAVPTILFAGLLAMLTAISA